MRAIAAAFVLAAAMLCSGCASVTQGMTHSLRVEAATDKGELVAGAECTLSNEDNSLAARSGDSVTVRRSAKDLTVSCTRQGLPEATARLVSRANMGLAGNILLGGAIGAMVDHSNGSAYTYPTWVRLVFGHYAVFDRRDEQPGVPLVYSGPHAMPQAMVAAPAARPEPAPAATPSHVPAPLREPAGAPGALERERVRLEAERIELERLESDRREAAARLQSQRLELARLELARLEAARLELARLELARLEVERQAAAASMEAQRSELARLDRQRAQVVWARPGTGEGDAFNYRITDRVTGGIQTVVLRVERASGDEVSFNNGARVERPSGELVRLNSALLGELDLVTPARGWMPDGHLPSGTWKIQGASIVPGAMRAYDLTASLAGEETLQVGARRIVARRIALTGWVQNDLSRVGSATARYEASVWVSPELRRVVRFEAKARTAGNMASAYLHIDEASELLRIGAD
jgi:hypothetical protein